MTKVKQTLSTHCFDAIKNSILHGEYLPGEKLLCEGLKNKFSVGMSPIREALAKLTATNLVTFEERRGYTVRKMKAKELSDNILTFAEIESLCLKLSISNGDDAWEGNIIAALHCINKIEKSDHIDFNTKQTLNVNFQNILVSACPLKALMQIRNEFFIRHQWYVRLCYQFTNADLYHANHAEYQVIANLAMERKTEETSKKLFDQITFQSQDIISQLERRGLIDHAN